MRRIVEHLAAWIKWGYRFSRIYKATKTSKMGSFD